ncbi:sulfur carrier protein ThiS [Gilvimarinus agarilyticus]|uniref:sulfur carrier protein ThiS n=1 Tax=unclassified Gilvimarinus TaxID=2642066 RepID=UPI001C09B706|nr:MULTISPECIES: sulfur carrier protein ThiS [unclassified Gilvimarinus]MBU2887297.1 sulfur carrier protein ThiS [Gilvimarinus agarilyticus]MDO6571956.1 sulfur carrier protein ThiS [Gilvimarinus sp. 2_MG-2023]MDO6746024.1 sulfur carrier protein ThiS [Gilvimarinus sp. 1_MG-2023]
MKSNDISIAINASPVTLKAPASLSDALQQWQSEPSRVACALNGEFVPRSAYPSTRLSEGDQVEIVQPVGGG